MSMHLKDAKWLWFTSHESMFAEITTKNLNKIIKYLKGKFLTILNLPVSNLNENIWNGQTCCLHYTQFKSSYKIWATIIAIYKIVKIAGFLSYFINMLYFKQILNRRF